MHGLEKVVAMLDEGGTCFRALKAEALELKEFVSIGFKGGGVGTRAAARRQG
jgi:hypothetical protein